MAVMAPPRISLGTMPTPLQLAPRLADALGISRLYVKRDDLTGFSLGGNKIRKLEYLLADAGARGADTVLVCGGPASNLCQAAAAAAEVLDFECELILYGDRPSPPPLNLQLAEMSGAVARFTNDDDRSSVDELAITRANDLRADGRQTFIIPRGGATPVGALGYHDAALELAAQLRAAGTNAASIVVGVGSGGTLAGILSGAAALNENWQLIGASVSRSREEATVRVQELAAECSGLLGIAPPSMEATILDARGAGYGLRWPEADRAAELARQTEALLFDPVYTAKALATLARIADDLDGPVVFWHTGGIGTAIEVVARKDLI